jgi:hypothetical protein
MPTEQAPIDVNEPKQPEETPAVVVRGSRWIDYDTHELLQMIGELEDERRWARLREGIWIAILIHLALISALTWIPKYIFKAPLVVDSSKLNQHKDFTYLDTPWQAPKAAPKPKVDMQRLLDKQTREEMKQSTPPAPQPAPQSKQAAPAPVQPPPPTQPTQQPPVEVPHPAAVPARPNFQHYSAGGEPRGAGGGLAMHPGAGTGGVQVLSDTQGVDFNNWLSRWYYETKRTWDPLIPDEVNPPIYKSGVVAIHFKVLPNGRLMDGSLTLEGRSGDVALDRAAWGALTGSNYPPLPREFHGPYLELRAYFLYNTEPPR